MGEEICLSHDCWEKVGMVGLGNPSQSMPSMIHTAIHTAFVQHPYSIHTEHSTQRSHAREGCAAFLQTSPGRRSWEGLGMMRVGNLGDLGRRGGVRGGKIWGFGIWDWGLGLGRGGGGRTEDSEKDTGGRTRKGRLDDWMRRKLYRAR